MRINLEITGFFLRQITGNAVAVAETLYFCWKVKANSKTTMFSNLSD